MSEAKLAADTGNSSADPPPFLQHLTATQNGPRNLLTIAKAIDQLDARSSGDPYSAERVWRLAHKFVSQKASHANVMSIKPLRNDGRRRPSDR